MSFVLALLLATAADTPTMKPAADPEKVRCKRYTETGSLAKVVKECHTNAEWEDIRRHGAADGHRMMGPGYDPNHPTGGN